MSKKERLDFSLRDRLVERGRSLFQQEVMSDFARIRRLRSETSLIALGALLSAPASTLAEWAHVLPEVGVLLGHTRGDRASHILSAAANRGYLDACSDIRQRRDWSLRKDSNQRPPKNELKLLRHGIQTRMNALGMSVESLDPTTKMGELAFGSFVVRTFFSAVGRRLTYGHTVFVEGEERFINLHFMAWLGLTTTEWELSDDLQGDLLAVEVVDLMRLFLIEVEGVGRIVLDD